MWFLNDSAIPCETLSNIISVIYSTNKIFAFVRLSPQQNYRVLQGNRRFLWNRRKNVLSGCGGINTLGDKKRDIFAGVSGFF
jgi:hypothetical protein